MTSMERDEDPLERAVRESRADLRREEAILLGQVQEAEELEQLWQTSERASRRPTRCPHCGVRKLVLSGRRRGARVLFIGTAVGSALIAASLGFAWFVSNRTDWSLMAVAAFLIVCACVLLSLAGSRAVRCVQCGWSAPVDIE